MHLNPAHQSVKSCVRYLCRASARLQISSLSFALCRTVLNALFTRIAIDFGCEERPKGMPVMAIVTLMDSSGEEIRIKAEDAMLYECNINEGDKVCLDANNKLEKVK